MAKYKPQDNNINVTSANTDDNPAKGTRDNDKFIVTSETGNATISAGNQATDTLYFADDFELKSITVLHASNSKDLHITYTYGTSSAKTITVKDYFSSTKATAAKSSLKNLHYNLNGEIHTELFANEVLIYETGYTTDNKRHKITGTNFADNIALGNGDTAYTINSGNGNDAVYGSAQADTINGGNGDDYIVGFSGDDNLTGGKGKNTYVYNFNYAPNGNDTITLTKTENATIDYKGSLENVAYTLDNKGNAKITFDTTNENKGSATLKNFGKSDVANTIKLQGTDTLVPNDLKTQVWEYTATGDYKGTWLNEHIDARGITVEKTNKRGKHIDISLNGGKGNDIIESTDFADKVTGGLGTNTYKYTTLTQLKGDKICLTKGESARIDVSGIENAKATYSISGKDLVVTVTGTENETEKTESFTIVNYGTKDVTGANGGVVLIDSDGETDLKTDITLITNTGTFHNDYINRHENSRGLTINGGGGNDIIIGTDKKDTIKAGTGLKNEITGGQGNDSLYASTEENSKTNFYFTECDGKDTVYSGKGDDTLVLEEVSFVDVTFKKTKTDLIVKYSTDDQITIKNYYKNGKVNPKNSIKHIKTNDGVIDIESIKNIVTVTDTSDTYAIDTDNNLVMMAETEANRTLVVSGNNNAVLDKGQALQTVNVTGTNNSVALYNTGNPETEANKNNVTVTTNDNVISVGGGYGSKVSLSGADGLTGNSIYVIDGTDNKVNTSSDGETYVEASTSEGGVTQIKTYGCDTITLGSGDHNVAFSSFSHTNDYDETINLKEDMSKVDIDNIYTPDSVSITQSLDTLPDNIVFEHYMEWIDPENNYSDHVSIKYLDKDRNVLNENTNELNFNGKWSTNNKEWPLDKFNLDNPLVWDNVTISAQSGTDTITKTLDQMTQYYDMSKTRFDSYNNRFDVLFFDYSDPSKGIEHTPFMNISKDVYIKGSGQDDYYWVDDITALDKQFVINETGGGNDIIVIDATKCHDFKFFFDVDTSGKVGNDLYLITTSGETSEFSKFINNEYSNYILIENQLEQKFERPHEIEHITANYIEQINYKNYISSIKSSIAGWLNNYNDTNDTEYGTVMEAIKDGAGDAALLSAYTTNAETTWNNSWSGWSPD